MVFKNLLSVLSLGALFFPSPVLSSSYEPLKYPLPFSCSRGPCRIYRTLRNDTGFLPLDMSPADYFYHLVHSNKVTSKGYPYSYCQFQIDIIVRLDLINKWGENNLGFNYYTTRYKPSSSGSISYSGDSQTNFGTKVSPSALPSSTLQIMQSHTIDLTKYYSPNNTKENYYSSVTIQANDYSFYKYGCDTVPVETSSQCPNMIIRGLPFIRGTVRCN